MLDLKPDIQWQQYFPTYKIENRDIILEEYKASSNVLANEEKSFTTISRLIVFTCTLLLPILIPLSNNNITDSISSLLFKKPDLDFFVISSIALFLITLSFFLLLYISRIRKNVVYAARKVIALRRILGLSFGRASLVLPSDRLEGADDPFHIKFYTSFFDSNNLPFIFTAFTFSFLLTIVSYKLESDFNSLYVPFIVFTLTLIKINISREKIYKLFPLIIITMISICGNNAKLSFSIYFCYNLLLSVYQLHLHDLKKMRKVYFKKWINLILKKISESFCIFVFLAFYFYANTLILFLSSFNTHYFDKILVFFVFFFSYYIFYRAILFSKNENFKILVSNFLAYFFNVNTSKNFDTIIYRTILTNSELKRVMKLNITSQSNIIKMLVYVEDKNFFAHPGVCVISFARLILGICYRKQKIGSSSLNQQLSRTLFIKYDAHNKEKTYRRKICELFYGIAIDGIYSKDEILSMYLSAVRFEKGINGLTDAIKYFFSQRRITLIKKRGYLTLAESYFLVERIGNMHSVLLSHRINAHMFELINDKILKLSDVEECLNIYEESIIKGLIIDKNNRFSYLKKEVLDYFEDKSENTNSDIQVSH